ncbi:cystin-1 isoform X1 [Zalophus californianus]|uniref:Cystin-1 isoform X1 n=1 Tax=Zalophus californianus TaxID=9704 RepID=A0A6J2FDF4_ZALCA|nr:cystin-1 isoform X1 [Zalophus californianus]
MGSGSSRSGRALRRLRSPDSRPAGPGGAASEGGTRPLVSATAAAAAREEAREAEAAEGAADPDPDRDPGPADGGNETLRLLDQLLAESAAWGPGELVPRGPARPKPAAGAGSRKNNKNKHSGLATVFTPAEQNEREDLYYQLLGLRRMPKAAPPSLEPHRLCLTARTQGSVFWGQPPSSKIQKPL